MNDIGWAGFSLPPTRTFNVAVTIRTSRKDCPQLEGLIEATVNGVDLELSPGGYNEYDDCEPPKFDVQAVEIAGDDMALELDDGTTAISMQVPGLIAKRTLTIIEPATACCTVVTRCDRPGRPMI